MLFIVTVILRFLIWLVCLVFILTNFGNLVYLKMISKYISIAGTVLIGVIFGYFIPPLDHWYVIAYYWLIMGYSWHFKSIYRYLFLISAFVVGYGFEIYFPHFFNSIKDANFIILTMACTGGFMVTHYSTWAGGRGLSVGGMFRNKMSLVMMGGYLCLFGSIIISFFVNPWWSAFMVLFLGFFACISAFSFLRAYSQPVSIVLIITSFILIPAYIFWGS